MDTETLLQKLSHDSWHLSPFMESLLADPTLGEVLCTALKQAIVRWRCGGEERSPFPLIHLLFLLREHAHTEAFPLLLNLLSLPEEERGEPLNGLFLDAGGVLLAGLYAPCHDAAAKAFICDRTLPFWARVVVVSLWVNGVVLGRVPREAALAVYAELLEWVAHHDPALLHAVLFALSALRPVELLPRVKELLDRGIMVEPYSLEEFKTTLQFPSLSAETVHTHPLGDTYSTLLEPIEVWYTYLSNTRCAKESHGQVLEQEYPSIDQSEPRTMFFDTEVGRHRGCPSCGAPLFFVPNQYLMGLGEKRPAEYHVVGPEGGLYCLECPTVVLEAHLFDEVADDLTGRPGSPYEIFGIFCSEVATQEGAFHGEEAAVLPVIPFKAPTQ